MAPLRDRMMMVVAMMGGGDRASGMGRGANARAMKAMVADRRVANPGAHRGQGRGRRAQAGRSEMLRRGRLRDDRRGPGRVNRRQPAKAQPGGGDADRAGGEHQRQAPGGQAARTGAWFLRRR
jgi:hypothetical protein